MATNDRPESAGLQGVAPGGAVGSTGSSPTGPSASGASGRVQVAVYQGATGPVQPESVQLADYPNGPLKWSEHLHYEADMLHWVRRLWDQREVLRGALQAELSAALDNVLVESFLVHARNLVEFFREREGGTDSRHFYVSNFLGSQQARKWREKYIDGARATQMEAIWVLASAHVAHPSRNRTHSAEERQVMFDDHLTLFDYLMTALVKNRDVAPNLSKNVDWSRWRNP